MTNYEFNGITPDENDGISYAIDYVLGAPGIRKACLAEKGVDWIMLIGDKSMEIGIRELPPVEQEIVKLYFIAGKSLLDIAADLDMPVELLCGHIKSMRVRLMCYV